jgi:hypothetical protein
MLFYSYGTLLYEISLTPFLMRRKRHPFLGHMSIHHLVPRVRISLYYGTSFHMPKNRLRLWRVKHDAWHALFHNKSLNEIIRYLSSSRTQTISVYRGPAWSILFRNKTPAQAKRLLKRLRRIKRKQYQHLEFDPAMKHKAARIVRTTQSVTYVRIHFDKKFQHTHR